MAIGILKPVTAISACQELAALVTRHTDDLGNGAHKTAIPQLEFMRELVVSTAMCGVAEPILAIVVQGWSRWICHSVDLYSKRRQSSRIWASS